MHAFESSTHWDEKTRTLHTRFAGVPDLYQVDAWKKELWAAAGALPSGATFKLLMDLRGYSVDEVPREVHFEQRRVIPEFLLAHGFRIGYLNLFAEKGTPVPGPEGRVCVGAAHVHHEIHKMEFYQEKFGTEADRYFTDRAEAEGWIASV